jgi:hypothetical protein
MSTSILIMKIRTVCVGMRGYEWEVGGCRKEIRVTIYY